jgi:hypothetical protein
MIRSLPSLFYLAMTTDQLQSISDKKKAVTSDIRKNVEVSQRLIQESHCLVAVKPKETESKKE